MTAPRHVFYISDRTGLTAENIGEALLNQFGRIEFKRHTYPFIDTPEKARTVVEIVNRNAQENGLRPIAFVSVVNDEIREIIKKAGAFHINFFETFLGLLEKELNTEAVAAEQGHHSIGNTQRYDARMEAVNFSLNHDDGVSDKNLKEADVILMGVSRSGKTPTLPCPAIRYPRRQLPADSRRFGIHRPAAHGQTLQRQAVRPDHSTRTPAGHPSRAPSEFDLCQNRYLPQ